MATKKKTAKKATKKLAARVIEVSPAVMKMRENYAELARLNELAAEAMQAAYRFARDNMLIYQAPVVALDDDDAPEESDDYEESWSSSDC